MPQCDLEVAVQMKLRHDFAGHYNRPDIFHLQINRAAPKLYSVHGTGDRLPALSAARAKLRRSDTRRPAHC